MVDKICSASGLVRGLRKAAGVALMVLLPASASAQAPNGAGTAVVANPPAIQEPTGWQAGPRKIALLDQASMQLPAGLEAMEGAQAQQMLRALGNPNVDNVLAIVTGFDRDWLAVVRFDKAGYIRETDTRNWDIDALLESIRQGSAASNDARRERKVSELEVLGWLEAPRYDPLAKRLAWGIAIRNQGEEGTDTAALNYNTYLLGRQGYFTLNLITGLAQIDRNRPHAEVLMAGFEFNESKRYLDYASGSDQVAPFGLSALVANAHGSEAPAQAKAGKKVNPAGASASFGMMAAIASAAIFSVALLALAAWWLARRRKETPMIAELPPQAEEDD